MKPDREMESVEGNPYLEGRREWNERYGSYIQARATWQKVALLAVLVALLAVAGVVMMGLQNKHIPYIVEIDKLGSAVAVAPAQQTSQQDVRVIKHALAEFITNYRTVYGDRGVQKDAIFKAYRYVMPSSPAYVYVSESYQKNSPFDRMQKERVEVEVTSVIQISENTWQIDWIENNFDATGHATGSDNCKGAATLKFVTPTSEKEIFANPTGLWINELSWQKVLK